MAYIQNLTVGNVTSSISRMAFPLIASSFVQMTYTMADMMWLGHLGSEHVAAVGAAFFLVWLSNSLSYCPRSGAEVLVSQSLGAGDTPRAIQLASHAVYMAVAIALVYTLCVLVGAPAFLHCFQLDRAILAEGTSYLRWVSPAMVFGICNNTFAGILYGMGNSRTPFRIMLIGLCCNILLDPLLIYGYGPIPSGGVIGAAIATVLSQCVVFILFILNLFGNEGFLSTFWSAKSISAGCLKRICRIGLPVTFQNAFFSFISMALTAMTAPFGHECVAVGSIGSQIEAVSWMTADGFSTALSSFTGQNYGARLFHRIRRGFYVTIAMGGTIGLVAAIAFIGFGESLFSLFVPEAQTVVLGGIYLYIQSFSQPLMVAEKVATGGFNGLGLTQIPSLTGILVNLMRLPIAYYLIKETDMGVAGIWWAISATSIIKGIILSGWYLKILRNPAKRPYFYVK